MKYIKYSLAGILFGITMTKSEAVSWFRIQEMFRFESFHMYGIIGTAVVLGSLLTFVFKNKSIRTLEGQAVVFNDKNFSIPRYLVGGIVFGLGWAMTGACPGPMFTLVGHGVWSMLIVIISAVGGTYAYGLLRDKLPH